MRYADIPKIKADLISMRYHNCNISQFIIIIFRLDIKALPV